MSMGNNDWVRVFASPLNNSTAKTLYTVPKAKRFNQNYKTYCKQACYDLPDQKMTRKAALGYGQKYDFTRGQMKTPASSQYEMKSIFTIDKEKNIGKTMGVSRSQMAVGGIMSNKNTNPGPGKYEISSTKSNIQYSFRQKILYGDPFNSVTKLNPGPGVYETKPTLNANGRYFNSKYKASGAGLINPARSKRFNDRDIMNVPGPGQYKPFDMPQNGKYFLSKNKSTASRTFAHDTRKFFEQNKLKTPGPGSYRLPSDFGYYESKRPQTSKSTGGSRVRIGTAQPGGRKVQTNNFFNDKADQKEENNSNNDKKDENNQEEKKEE